MDYGPKRRNEAKAPAMGIPFWLEASGIERNSSGTKRPVRKDPEAKASDGASWRCSVLDHVEKKDIVGKMAFDSTRPSPLCSDNTKNLVLDGPSKAAKKPATGPMVAANPSCQPSLPKVDAGLAMMARGGIGLLLGRPRASTWVAKRDGWEVGKGDEAMGLMWLYLDD
ncbi:hypothetical protein CDD82_6874 [Ophiocordyceps australis]|uniref:Uncharacterized protein n=1 Tax=Ophiocordyceps australis TaxID=1399860 RepID=A0A2C5YTD0_9HYPO|nr:hypothetical protein CDD82_6874 [Ophiocordyceps australis]